MTKKQRIMFITAGAILLLACSFWQINKINEYSSQYFLDHTIINGVNCSNMTLTEAKETLTERWNGHNFKIMKNGETLGEIQDLNLTYAIDQQLKRAMNEPLFKRVFRYVTKKKEVISITMTVAAENDQFRKQIEEMDFLNRKSTVKTKDAHVDLSNRKFEIVKEVQGDNIDKSRFKRAVLKAIAAGNFTLEYNASDYYQQPKIYSTDPALNDYKAYCEKNYSQIITYRFYNKG